MVPTDRIEDNQELTQELNIRTATVADAPGITEIFNHAIQHTTASFYFQPRTIEQRTHWLTTRPDRYAVLVAQLESRVVGWAALDPWSEKRGYRISAEISYYVHPEFHGRNIGSQLVQALERVARQNQFRNLLAKICENNLVSLKLAQRAGFQHAGTLRSVGEKFGRAYDVHFYQKQLDSQPPPQPDDPTTT